MNNKKTIMDGISIEEVQKNEHKEIVATFELKLELLAEEKATISPEQAKMMVIEALRDEVVHFFVDSIEEDTTKDKLLGVNILDVEGLAKPFIITSPDSHIDMIRHLVKSGIAFGNET